MERSRWDSSYFVDAPTSTQPILSPYSPRRSFQLRANASTFSFLLVRRTDLSPSPSSTRPPPTKPFQPVPSSPRSYHFHLLFFFSPLEPFHSSLPPPSASLHPRSQHRLRPHPTTSRTGIPSHRLSRSILADLPPSPLDRILPPHPREHCSDFSTVAEEGREGTG